MVILFDHRIVHEGAQLKTGFKDILRTELIFSRVEDSETEHHADSEFLRLYYLAGQYEIQNQMEMAISTYKAAAKVNPKVAREYGL